MVSRTLYYINSLWVNISLPRDIEELNLLPR